MRLLKRIRNVIIDVEVLDDEITFDRVRRFLNIASKLIPERVKVFDPQNYSGEQINLIHKLGLTQKALLIDHEIFTRDTN
jgi:hypothetical protein